MDAAGDRIVSRQMGACILERGSQNGKAVHPPFKGWPNGLGCRQNTAVLRWETLLDGLRLGSAARTATTAWTSWSTLWGAHVPEQGRDAPYQNGDGEQLEDCFGPQHVGSLCSEIGSDGVREEGYGHQRPGLLGTLEVICGSVLRRGGLGICASESKDSKCNKHCVHK